MRSNFDRWIEVQSFMKHEDANTDVNEDANEDVKEDANEDANEVPF